MSAGVHPAGRLEKAITPKSSMHVDGESDGRVVPAKGSNNGGQPPAESLEGRRPTKESIGQPTPPRTQCRTRESSGLLGVRQVAQREKRTRFTALLHHITVARLQESFSALKREAAPGVDGVTWREYETDLGTHLVDLHRRVHAGTYRAQPSKRAYIPKADGRQRPLGIAALEDKIVQHAVGVVLSAIYEQDFLGFSYGFRPERSQHHALDALWVGLMRKKLHWVLDADIRTFFDTMDHGWVRRFLVSDYCVVTGRSNMSYLYEIPSTGINGVCPIVRTAPRQLMTRFATNWRGRGGTTRACGTTWLALNASAASGSASASGCAGRTSG